MQTTMSGQLLKREGAGAARLYLLRGEREGIVELAGVLLQGLRRRIFTAPHLTQHRMLAHGREHDVAIAAAAATAHLAAPPWDRHTLGLEEQRRAMTAGCIAEDATARGGLSAKLQRWTTLGSEQR